jgi:hypothetical protein
MGGQRDSVIASGNALNQTTFIEKTDFSKPEKFLPEIMEFLSNVTIVQGLSVKPK